MKSRSPHRRRGSQIESAWRVVRELRRFTLRDVMHRASVQEGELQTLLLGWAAAGIIEREDWGTHTRREDGTFGSGFYVLRRDTGIRPPRVDRHGHPVTRGLVNENIWVAVQRLASFDHREVLAIASTDQVRTTAWNVRSTIHAWYQAQLLELVTAARPGTPARYRLAPGCGGPLPPMILRSRTVYDQNRGQVLLRDHLHAQPFDLPAGAALPAVKAGTAAVWGSDGTEGKTGDFTRSEPLSDRQVQELTVLGVHTTHTPMPAAHHTAPRLNHTQAARQLFRAGIAMDRDRYQWLVDTFPDGVDPDSLKVIIQQIETVASGHDGTSRESLARR